MRMVIAGALLFLAVGARAEDVTPDTAAILSLWGRHSFASGCPIAADRVVTNAHVLDIAPFNRDMPLFPYRYGVGAAEGTVVPRGSSNREDLAIGEAQPPLAQFYRVATTPPAPGETLWWVGYDRKNRKAALERKLFKGKVVRTVAGNVVVDEETTRGSSGSCMLNSRGEVVAIVAWGLVMDNEDEITIGVGLWGEWAKELLPQ